MKKRFLFIAISITFLFGIKAQTPIVVENYISASGQADLPRNSSVFSYTGAGTPWNGTLLTIGGFNVGSYPLQLNADYGPAGGNHISFRTRTDDAGAHWNSWYELYHSGNLNRNDVDFSVKNHTVYGVLKTINKDNSVATWDNLSIWTDGGSSYIQGNNDENGLRIKSNTGNKIFLESNVGIGLFAGTSPRAIFDVGDFSANSLKSILARLPEGDGAGEGTYLGVKSYDSQPEAGQACCGNIKSFAIEHKFYGQANSSVNFYRGGGYTGGYLTFNTNDNTERMRIDATGNVLIGKTSQTNTAYKLDVAGSIRANEIKVNTTGADFVFESTYQLRPLSEVETFIKAHKHLPEIAPAADMQANGVSMGEMQAKLLQKLEELTLYSIEQDKKLVEQDKAKAKLEVKVEEQGKQLQEQRQSNADLKQQLADQAKKIEQLEQLISQKLK